MGQRGRQAESKVTNYHRLVAPLREAVKTPRGEVKLEALRSMLSAAASALSSCFLSSQEVKSYPLSCILPLTVIGPSTQNQAPWDGDVVPSKSHKLPNKNPMLCKGNSQNRHRLLPWLLPLAAFQIFKAKPYC